MTTVLRVIEAEDKAAALREAIQRVDSPLCFAVDPRGFRHVPRSPFAYWVSERVRRLFSEAPSEPW